MIFSIAGDEMMHLQLLALREEKDNMQTTDFTAKNKMASSTLEREVCRRLQSRGKMFFAAAAACETEFAVIGPQ